MEQKQKTNADLKAKRAALAVRLQNEKMEGLRAQRGKEPRKPKKPRGPRSDLTVLQVAMLLGTSRDSVYRLIQSGKLADLHPVSVNKLLVAGLGFSPAPLRYIEMHQEWSAKWVKYRKDLEHFLNQKAGVQLQGSRETS